MLVVAPVGLSGASFPPVLDQVSLQLTAHLKTKTRTEARDFEMGCGWPQDELFDTARWHQRPDKSRGKHKTSWSYQLSRLVTLQIWKDSLTWLLCDFVKVIKIDKDVGETPSITAGLQPLPETDSALQYYYCRVPMQRLTQQPNDA